MNMTQGIKMFGDAGVAAVKSELQQLHDRKVMAPVMASSLTREQRIAALAYLMFLKRKRCGKIKGRGCADGRKQRKYIRREGRSYRSEIVSHFRPKILNEIFSFLSIHDSRISPATDYQSFAFFFEESCDKRPDT
jgi:hypothetical protein